MSFRRRSLDPATASALVALEPGETLTFIGRCGEPRCRRGVRLELEGVVIFGPDSPHYAFGIIPEGTKWSEPAPPPRGFSCPEGSRWMGAGGYLTSFAGKDHQCPDHWRPYDFRELRAVLVGDVPCSSTCEQATGSDCKCSCGGANHGVAAS